MAPIDTLKYKVMQKLVKMIKGLVKHIPMYIRTLGKLLNRKIPFLHNSKKKKKKV